MTVIPDDQPSNRPSDAKNAANRGDTHSQEPPPSYSPQADPAASQGIPPSRPHTFKTKPTNFLTLSHEHTSIRGEFVIDPSIRIPSSMLPPLCEGETENDRKNLCLTSQSAVHANIWLLSPTRDDGVISRDEPRRTRIVLASDHGSIRAQVQTLDGAGPFSLTASATHGAIQLSLPRSFQGLLSLSTRHGNISVGDAIIENATQLSPQDATQRFFVGDFHLLGEDEWQGDQVDINGVHGSIRVTYMGDVAETQGRKGLLSWLFGK